MRRSRHHTSVAAVPDGVADRAAWMISGTRLAAGRRGYLCRKFTVNTNHTPLNEVLDVIEAASSSGPSDVVAPIQQRHSAPPDRVDSPGCEIGCELRAYRAAQVAQPDSAAVSGLLSQACGAL